MRELKKWEHHCRTQSLSWDDAKQQIFYKYKGLVYYTNMAPPWNLFSVNLKAVINESLSIYLLRLAYDSRKIQAYLEKYGPT